MQAMEASSWQTHWILKARMRADLKVYQDAVAELNESLETGFQKAHKRAEIARIAYEAAVEKFGQHVEAHGCQSVNA